MQIKREKKKTFDLPHKRDEIKLLICIAFGDDIDATSPMIEMVDYHNSNWYKNKNDVSSYIEYARCLNDINDKIKYYLKALSIKPYVEEWNNEYILCLVDLNKYDAAYQHILKI